MDNSPRARFQAWAAQPDNAAMEELCAFIVAGEEQGHLKAFCGEHGFNYTTALAWIARDPARSELYARAREDRSDTIAERILSVADEDCTTPIMGTQIIDGVLVEVEVGRKVDPAKVQLLRLKSDNLKWSASKLKPKMYGDKLDVNANINTNELSDQELARRLAGFGIDIIAIAGAAPGSSHGG